MSRIFETLAFTALVAFVGIQATHADDAGETKHIAVFIDKQNDANAQIDVKVNGDKYEFTLPKLAEGESRTISTTDGKAVVVSRKDDRVSVKIGDETIYLPNIDSKEHELIATFHGGPTKIHTKNEIAVSADKLTMEGHLPLLMDKETLANTLIISGAKLSDDEQKKVKDALKEAGIKQDVKFVHAQKSIAVVKDDKFKWSGDADADHHVVILNMDGDKSEEKQIKIIRKTEESRSDKK